jgi:DEAD/DEAH box helicase domain-containing protein
MTDNNAIDYAAIIRAAQEHLPDAPDGQALEKQIYSTERGNGEVKALLGKRLVVCYQNEDELTQISDWQSDRAGTDNFLQHGNCC